MASISRSFLNPTVRNAAAKAARRLSDWWDGFDGDDEAEAAAPERAQPAQGRVFRPAVVEALSPKPGEFKGPLLGGEDEDKGKPRATPNSFDELNIHPLDANWRYAPVVRPSESGERPVSQSRAIAKPAYLVVMPPREQPRFDYKIGALEGLWGGGRIGPTMAGGAILDRARAYGSQGLRVATIGGGLGSLARAMVESGAPEAVNIDWREDCLVRAAAADDRFGLSSKIQHWLIDPSRWAFEGQTFDHIMSFDALTYLEDRWRMIVQVRDALRPGGQWTVCDFLAEEDAVFVQGAWAEGAPWPRVIVEHELRRAGLRLVSQADQSEVLLTSIRNGVRRAAAALKEVADAQQCDKTARGVMAETARELARWAVVRDALLAKRLKAAILTIEKPS